MGKVDRRPKRKPTSIYLTAYEAEALSAICQMEGRSQGEAMREMIRAHARELGIVVGERVNA